MLTAAMPAAPTFKLETAYRAGVRDLEVGGDWYDAFWLDEPDRLALLVGDVVGKGLDAAATMGQLRSAVRAYALTVRGPAELLDALDRYARHHHIGRLTTLIYADLDLRTRHLRYAVAGHPPPILITDERSTRRALGRPLHAARLLAANRPAPARKPTARSNPAAA